MSTNSKSLWAILVSLGVLALVSLGVMLFLGRHPPVKDVPGPGGALQVEMGKPDPKSDVKTTPVRCFVNGALDSVTTLSECARKNGSASQALDVGLGGTANADAASTSMAPATTPPTVKPADPSATAECLKYGPEGWKGYGQPITLSACVRVLYQGQCPQPGDPAYAHWGTQTLRQSPGGIEISDDNRRFRPLVAQNSQDCSLPPM